MIGRPSRGGLGGRSPAPPAAARAPAAAERGHVLRWLDGDGSAPCPVCESTATCLVAEVDGNGLRDVAVERCSQCGSLRLVGPALDYSGADEAVDDYVEGGVGIDAIAQVLCGVRRTSVRRFLDVGCYYGFGVHLAQHLLGWEAVGVEPSGAGERGRAELGVDVRTGFLEEVGEIGTFDLVLASEVVEHVTEPVRLLAQIRQSLNPLGLLVLTTPAAEVVTPPAEREAEVVQALSPGHHRFLASVPGLRLLLERAGFGHHRVVRDGATLRAVAATDESAMASVVEGATIDQRELLAYLDLAAAEAPPGSALACGHASRHFRMAVTIGDFPSAEKSVGRLCEQMLARRGFDLTDPARCMDDVRGGRRPAWNLAGAAYCMGMLEFAGRQDRARAASYFELADAAAAAWTRASGTVDVDTAMLRELSLGHRCLALAWSDPAAAGGATRRLAEVLDADIPAQRERSGWWKVRTFVELVAAGTLDVDPALVVEVEGAVDGLARSPHPDYRRAGLDGLFLLGIRALNTGSPTVARAWFTCCAGACREAPAGDAHARRLAADARAHDEMAAERGGAAPALVAPADDDPRVVVGIDAYWCDPSGLYLRGWAHAGHETVDRISLTAGGRRTSQRPTPRGDVSDLYAATGVPPNCGFALYLEGRPGSDVRLELDAGGERLGTAVALPDHPLPVLEHDPADVPLMMDRMLSLAGPGPVLAIGWRVAAGTDLCELKARFGSRRVVNVDIHPGLNVDVVGDAHRLSHLFRPGAFAAALSAAVLEHVAVPWVVAAELNRVLSAGAPVLHVAPTTWPEHASPNDFWRFTADGLAVLFGPATGFEVLEKGSANRARIHPDPTWRRAHLDMPTMPAADQSWVLARKTADIPPGSVRWPYDPLAGERVARAYPEDALGDERGR